MTPSPLTTAVKQQALLLGFDLAGVCAAVAPTGYSRFLQWLEAGYAGQMHYLPARSEAYQHPRHLLEPVRSIVMLGMNYRTAEPQAAAVGEGRVSRYAWGSDYHDLIRRQLASLVQFISQLAPDSRSRGVVDTAPLLEREFAQLAGLGWIGKNSLLINKPRGSWFFLAALLTNLELTPDAPFLADHCGTCRACLDACPTQAFVAPYVLDARRCLSYTTIELREPIPTELRALHGDWLFGCDVCQEVCPWNRRASPTNASAFEPLPAMNPVDLAELFFLDEPAFRSRFRHTPLWRPRRRGLLRNAAIVLGNSRATSAVHALVRGLSDEEPLIRGASAWALGQIASRESTSALEDRMASEADADVRTEIAAARRSITMIRAES